MTTKILLGFCWIFLTAHLGLSAQTLAHKKVLLLMGSRFEITAVSADEALAWDAIEAACAEIARIEELISSWDPQSETSRVNAHAGQGAIEIGEELFNLIYRSKKVSDLTGGAFDISYASMDRLWQFDGSMTIVPDTAEIYASVSKVDFEKIVLNNETHEISIPTDMRLGFGAIGKGYAANRAREVMKARGITSGLVNAGGDLIAWGKQETGQSWKIAIADPNAKGKIHSWLEIGDMAVVTSGNYEKYVEIDGVRYSHIIDPRTGWPARGIKSVTIVCPDAELADALATAVFVLGEESGMQLVNQLRGIECIVINDRNQVIHSSHLQLNYYKKNQIRSDEISHTLGQMP